MNSFEDHVLDIVHPPIFQLPVPPLGKIEGKVSISTPLSEQVVSSKSGLSADILGDH